MDEKEVEVGGRTVRVTVDGDDVYAEYTDEDVEAVLVSSTYDEVHITNMGSVDIKSNGSNSLNGFTATFSDEDVHQDSPYGGNPVFGEEYDRDFHFAEMKQP